MSEKGTRLRTSRALAAYLPAALSVVLGACLYITFSVGQWRSLDRPLMGSGYFHRGSEVVFPLLCADRAREGTGLQPSG